jgi:hypothetical protein
MMGSMTEKQNAKQFPKPFYARHMQPGLCGYAAEKILVDTEALKRILPSGVGKPVYVNHDNGTDETRLQNLHKADGYITEAFYNELDGWGWFKILAVSDEAHEKIAAGWAVSNAYIPTQWGVGGTKNNCPYDREVLDAEFTHLAIVQNPRYEGALIFTPEGFRAYQDEKKRQLVELQNSKDGENKIMFKLFNTKKEPATADTVSPDTVIELQNGQSVSIQEMINAVQKKNEDEGKKKEEELENGDMEADVDGEKMPLKELVNRYKNSMKKNESDEDKKKDEEKQNALKAEADAKAAADKAAADAAEAEKLAGQKRFEELRNANNSANQQAPIIDTSLNQVARGMDRYGSGK